MSKVSDSWLEAMTLSRVDLRPTSFRDYSNEEKNKQKSRNDAEKSCKWREDLHR